MDNLFSSLFNIGILIGGLAYAYSKWRGGRDDGSLGTISLFKEQITALENKVKNQDNDIKTLTAEVHNLRLAIEEKDNKLRDTLTILQGRDPATQAATAAMKLYIESAKPVIELIGTEAIPTLRRLEKFLDKQSF
jgi:uncharacterized coiled-coil protein SlyX